ncbi:MAG: SdiA-regulated domain-containing protein, partial [Acetobacteraceae bacterium]
MPLGPGSIAFVGLNADGNDNIAFVALDLIPSGTIIFFQDNEWNGSAFNTGESAWAWSATSDIDPGTVIRVDSIGSASASDISTNMGSVVFADASNRGLSSGDEIVYAFLGSDAATPSVFLSAIANASLVSNASLAGTGLTDGVDALSLGVTSGADIAIFNGARDNLSSFADYRVAINNAANWIFQDGSGDQSADGTVPDVPFSTAPFTVSGAETQSVPFAAGSVSVALAEGDSGKTVFAFTVTRSGGTSGDVTFDATVALVSAGADDFVGTPPFPVVIQGMIAAGQDSTVIAIDVASDTTLEGNEQFTLTLGAVSNSDAAIMTTLGAAATATGTILNDDAPSFIGQVQGSGHISPLLGQVVTLTGVVTAIDTNGSRGFYMQDGGDGDATTSDGIFVFLPSGTLPTVGNQVQVTGTVAEFTPSGAAPGAFSTTELTSVASVVDLGAGPPVTPAVIGGAGGIVPPTEDLTSGALFYESLEGMLVTVTNPVAVGPTNAFGEIFTVVDSDNDPSNGLNATGLNARGDLLLTPGTGAFGDTNTVGGDFNPERIQIDDDNGVLSGFTTPSVDVGAVLSDVTGVVRYDFGNYEVIATQAYTVDTASTLAKETTVLAGTSDRLTVAAYNAENLDPGDGSARFDTIAAQIIANMQAPDIIALQEIQDNDGPTDSGTTAADTTLKMLVDAIAAAGGPAYAFIDNPFIGNGTNGGEPGGNIRTAFLYRTDRVGYLADSLKTIGADGSAVTAPYTDQQTNPDNPFYDSRLPLVATFTFNGAPVTVVNNHFTSKGGSAPLLGSDQPPLNNGEVQRAAQEQAVNTFVDGILSTNAAAKVVVIGDLNEFPSEEPMQVLKGTATITGYDVPATNPSQATANFTQGGTPILTDLQDTLPAGEQFDYVFEGNAETLDHVMVSDNIADGAQFDVVRINAEFANQTSDHEPLVASLVMPAFSLANYVRIGRYDLPEPTRTTAPVGSLLAQEVSAVTYNWDTGTLFVVGDGGTSIVQVTTTGQLIDSMTLAAGSSPQGTEFYDTEGLTYVGNGQFVMTEERDRQLVKFTYTANTTLTRDQTQTVKLGTSIGNVGFEGVSYDTQTAGFIVVKEEQPESIFQTNIDFAAGTATNGSPNATGSTDLFDPTLTKLLDFADVYALSNVTALNGNAASSHILILSQASGKIIEVDRTGTTYSTLDIVSDPGNPLSIPDQQHEGMAMGADGMLYVVSENGGGDFDHPQLWVYAPSSAANAAPSGVTLDNAVTAIDENTSTTSRLKVADVTIADDGLGTNSLSLGGADAAFFEVDSTGLYIKVGTVLDFETKTNYAVTVNVDDPTVGGSPDATVDYTLSVNDIANETPTAASVTISEVAPWSSGNSPVGADWFEVTNNGATALDITGWKVDDNSGAFASAVALNGVTTIAPDESVIFVESAAPADTVASFLSNWFGSDIPAGLQVGTYTGSGVGLSTGGDQVNLFDGSGTLRASVAFGTSPGGPFATFNNAAGLDSAMVTELSVAGVNGAFVAAADANEIGSPGTVGRLFISEVAPWSSGDSPVGADWFEVTNTTAHDIDITGWKMDDSSGSPAAAVALNGIITIHAGESVIFMEGADPATARNAFIDTWFGGAAPAGLQIGTYTGSGVGLGTSGDAVNLYDSTNALRASVTFAVSPNGPFATFDNTAGWNNATISQLSTVGTNNAFVAVNDPNETGSPGNVTPQPYTLQILHFYGESGTLGAETAPILGALVDQFRASTANTLTLAEGDTWIPGPWLVAGADPSLSGVGGIGSTAMARPDVAIMNALGVDASALGNHEFDLGSPIVSGAIAASGAWAGAAFPFITSNLDFSADGSLRGLADASLGGTAANAFAGQEASSIAGKIAPYTVVTVNGEKIGIVGATTYDLLSKTSPNGTVPKDDGDPSTDDLQEVANYIQASVDALRASGVNKIVMVDQLDTIARNQALAPLVSGIDVMVAGGGHERLGDATDTAAAFNGHDAAFVDTYPLVTADKDGNPTLIVTTDTEYTYLGRLEVQFTPDGVIDTSALDPSINGAYAATEATLQAVYNTTQSASEIVAGSTTGAAVQAIAGAIDAVVTAKDGTKFGFSNVYLEGDRVFGRAEETNLGDLTADANAHAARQALGGGAMPMVSLKNGGGLRASIGSIDENGSKIANPVTPGAAGNISQLDVENALRFDNKLMVFDTTPQGLLNILNYAAGLAPGNGGFPQVGGIRFSYDPDLAAGSRVQDVALYDQDGNFLAAVAKDGVLDANAPASIAVVILNFTANGGDGYPIKANGTNFRYLLDDGTVSASIDPSLDFTAAANVPSTALGEQPAFENYLGTFHATQQTAYSQADTPAALDLRIENLNVVATDAVIPCFAAGTMILTDRGEVAVEDLAVGDVVPTAETEVHLPIVWIGSRQVDCVRHPNPKAVWPIRVAKGAFGKGAPSRDLFLSPDHAVYCQDVLIPVKYLVNGTTIAQVEVDSVTYFLVVLTRREILLGEGLAVV